MVTESTNQSDEQIPASKADLLALIQPEWQTLQDTIAGASQAGLLRSGPEAWSPKDHLTHLAAWLEILEKHYLGVQSFAEAIGVDLSSLGGAYTTDGVNAIFFERYKDLPLAQVLLWLEQAHAAALARLDEVSFTDLMQPFDPHDPERRLLIQEVISNTSEHYQGHNRIIQALLAQP
jgi:hypothetical protein